MAKCGSTLNKNMDYIQYKIYWQHVSNIKYVSRMHLIWFIERKARNK